MRRILTKALILFLVFLCGVAGTSLLMNQGNSYDRSDMEAATLPEVMMEIDGVIANRMPGYREKMQVDFIRDCITPIDTTKRLKTVIDPYQVTIQSLSYEIRTSDGSKVLENQKIKSFSSQDSYLAAEFEIQSDLRMSQEYSMEITLETSQGELHYYTRVIQRSRLNAGEYLTFVRSFYEKSVDKTLAEDLGVYLEPDTNAQSGSYTQINIHASLDQISWGSLNPSISQKGIPTIKDINETTGSLVMEYQISASDEDGHVEYYDVREFYRMRFVEERIRLLDFERNAQQVFSGENATIDEDSLLIGVADRNLPYMANEEGHVVAFVQQGDLWSYSKEAGKIVRIFSFRQGAQGDFRDSRNEHNIKIMNVTEDGDVDFVLYGYMNRGPHEGLVGLCVYHYSNDQNAVEEKVFIPTKESYEFFDKDLAILSYINQKNQLFVMFSETLYQVYIDEGRFRVLVKHVPRDWFVVSETNAHAAWLDGEDPDGAVSITEIDFESLTTRKLHAAAGQYVRVLGFMNEDLIYGVTLQENVVEDAQGHKTFAMDTVKIQDFNGSVVKEYHQDGMYITDVTIGQTLMELELSAWEGSGYVAKATDTIMNNKKAGKDIVESTLHTTERQGVRVRLSFAKSIEEKEPLVVQAKMQVQEELWEMTMDIVGYPEEMYCVYAKGQLDSIYSNPADAVLTADAGNGVVLNRRQQYIWERGNRRDQVDLNLSDIPEVFLSGAAEPQALSEGLGETGQVLDLTGCALDQVLYCVSAQHPVLVKTGEDTFSVIVGYDQYNTWLYDPATQATEPYGMQDSTKLFESMGNVFFTYVEVYEE